MLASLRACILYDNSYSLFPLYKYFYGEALSFLDKMGMFHGSVRQKYFCHFLRSFGGCQHISARNKLALSYQVVIGGYVRRCLLSKNRHGSNLMKTFSGLSVPLG